VLASFRDVVAVPVSTGVGPVAPRAQQGWKDQQ
jgi:hypothetical protein